MEYSKLKSGTDIRGEACENPQGLPVTLTDEVVEAIAGAFLKWCEKRLGHPAEGLRIAVGRDSRISGPRILEALKRVFIRYGVQGLDCGLASTPSMFMAVKNLPCHCSVQITASHHPFYRNGLKFFTEEGGLDSPDISEILAYAQQGLCPEKECPGAWEEVCHMQTYAQGLREQIKREVNGEDYDHPLKGLHIVVDAGNGAGGFYAGEVLELLGADVSGSQFLEPDGMFPNHIPNPEDKEAMASISQAVVRAKADLGVIFDTDVDRGAAVDSTGQEISRNRLVALASAIALEKAPGGTIVTDSITSDGLKTYIEETLGGRHHRFKRGYKNVINEALRLNKEGTDCPLAIETSGHAAMRENYFLDDGAYLVTKIIIKLAALRKEGQDLKSLLAPLREAVEEREVRLPILAEDFRACGQKLIDSLEAYAKAQSWQIAPDSREGLRVSFPKGEGEGWFLLRLSVHDPILPLNIESDVSGGTEQIKEKLLGFFRSHGEGVDISPPGAGVNRQGGKRMTKLEEMGARARKAARTLAVLGPEKEAALMKAAQALLAHEEEILMANREDLAAGEEKGLTPALLDRLRLTPARIASMAAAMEEVAKAADPIGQVLLGEKRPNGLEIQKITVPLGVVGIIYEARPNVTSDACALCLKAGNAVILRGGKEALCSNKAIVRVLCDALTGAGLPLGSLQLVEDPGREAARELMGLTAYLDVLIPRGGAGLIRAVKEQAKVPVIETGVGNCHVYVDESANLDMAAEIIFNAKTSRPSVCNAIETVLVHSAIADKALPLMARRLSQKQVELRGCPRVRAILPEALAATEEDWATEYLDYILAVKVVDSLEEALDHIAAYSSGHSECIVTESYANAQRFLQQADSAAVYVNASTRFTDGGEFGLGAEIGISTQKLHARGPMGLQALTSHKFLIRGSGQVR